MSVLGTMRLPFTVTLCKYLRIMEAKDTNSQLAPRQVQSTVRSERMGKITSPKSTREAPSHNRGYTLK
jgi:hypothetical protein